MYPNMPTGRIKIQYKGAIWLCTRIYAALEYYPTRTAYELSRGDLIVIIDGTGIERFMLEENTL